VNRAYQKGSSLIPAIFLIVVITALGAFAIRIGNAQQSANDLSLLGERAQAAAQAGIEWAAVRVPSCPASSPATRFQVNGYSVDVDCKALGVVQPDGTNYASYEITSTASLGTFGSPDYVRRTVVTHL
jgi:MSHA biogenesis protein MshP